MSVVIVGGHDRKWYVSMKLDCKSKVFTQLPGFLSNQKQLNHTVHFHSFSYHGKRSTINISIARSHSSSSSALKKDFGRSCVTLIVQMY